MLVAYPPDEEQVNHIRLMDKTEIEILQQLDRVFDYSTMETDNTVLVDVSSSQLIKAKEMVGAQDSNINNDCE